MFRFWHPVDRAPVIAKARLQPRLAAGLALLLGCTEQVQVGRNFAGTGGGGGTAPAAGVAGDYFDIDPTPRDAAPADATQSPPAPCQVARCGNATLACGNCEDDDGDGLADAADPECLGPCDGNEAELFSGDAPRVNGSCRTDCYFDRNVGAGDDGCSWSYRCDPLAQAPEYFPTGLESCGYDPAAAVCSLSPNEQSACAAGCLPLTPNGCDCFGCCELPASSGRFIWLGSESLDLDHCELSTVADPARCRPCTPVAECQNDCAECELCVGKTSLPASCSGGLPVCATGQQACDPSIEATCGGNEYCITGCCVALPR
jgi:hypothetical protein